MYVCCGECASSELGPIACLLLLHTCTVLERLWWIKRFQVRGLARSNAQVTTSQGRSGPLLAREDFLSLSIYLALTLTDSLPGSVVTTTGGAQGDQSSDRSIFRCFYCCV